MFAKANEPSRQRFREALAGRMPDRVPYFDMEFGGALVRAVLDRSDAGASPRLEAERYAEFAAAVGVDFLYLNKVLSFGSPEEVRASVRQLIAALAPGGRYMCGSSHEISDAVPVENFRALVEAVHEFGAYRTICQL